jgi:PST family polysaccharide transporter
VVSLSGSAARGAFTTLSGQALRFLVQLASVTVLARLLTPDDYGLFVMVVAVVSVASVLGDFGLSMVAIQNQGLTPGQRSNLFWSNLALGVVLSGLVALAAHPLAAFYGRPEVVAITCAVAPLFLVNSLTAQFRAETTARMRFRALVVADVSGQLAGFAVAAVLAVQGVGYWALVAQQLTSAAVMLPILVVASRWWPGLPRRREGMASLYAFGANTLGVQLLVYLTSNVDNLLIGKVAGPATLGVYSRAYSLFRLPLQQVAAPLTRVAMPVLSRIHEDDDRFAAYVLRAQLLLSYCFGGLFLVLAAVSDPLIDIVLGDQWEEAKPLFVILAVGGAFQAIGYVYSWVFLSRAKTGLQLRVTVYGRVLMVLAMVVGTTWGATGVAVGASLGQALVWAVNTWVAMPRAGLDSRPLVRIALRPIAIFGVMAAATLAVSAQLTDVNAWLHGLVLTVVMVGILGAAALLLGSMRRDLRTLADTVRRVRSAPPGRPEPEPVSAAGAGHR